MIYYLQEMPRRIFEKWKKIAAKIADYQATVLLGFFYYLILAPFALVLKTNSDPLSLKRKKTDSYWLEGIKKVEGESQH